jgi:glycosyltransferase involved in cell wall biosynthesis
MPSRLRVVHAIHDFLPRHQAGSELYAADLASALAARGHHVTILAAAFDPTREHGTLAWRVHDGLPVVEIINNWRFRSFAETWDSPVVGAALDHVLRATNPDIVHVHNLHNLSLALPALARRHGAAVVGTLHDYTPACPSGGQRLHVAEAHICHTIEPERCVRCFRQSPFHVQLTFGAAFGSPMGRAAGRMAHPLRARVPGLVSWLSGLARHAPRPGPTPEDIEARLERARAAIGQMACIVAPSSSLASEYERLGFPVDRLRVRDYGFRPLVAPPRNPGPGGRLRLGFVGTLVWHKGAHVLVEAVSRLDPARVECLIFGDPGTSPEYSAALRRQAEGHPIRFMGRFERADAAWTYGQFDVLVIPSLWLENSPLVIHEAFQCGVPVIGARMGGIADLIDDGVSGLLYEATSASALVEAVTRLLDEPGLVTRLAAAAPAVRSIDDDAADWEGQYHAALHDVTRPGA